MSNLIYYFGALLFVLALAYVAIYLVSLYTTGQTRRSGLFKAKSRPRVEIVAQTPLDSKRKLYVVRRDDVEHLIMTGGPVDVVVESGIAVTDTTQNEADIGPESQNSDQKPEGRPPSLLSRLPGRSATATSRKNGPS